MKTRLTYEESFRFLQKAGWQGPGDVLPLPKGRPGYFDEDLGLSFFRTFVEEATLENLTIPRTYFSRSTVSKSSFAGTDLTESVANWNDFEDVDFSFADLTSFDFRACVLRRIRFCNVILKDSDLRCCQFENCDFTDADLTDAKITREAGATLNLSSMQLAQVSWQDEDGEDPEGG